MVCPIELQLDNEIVIRTLRIYNDARGELESKDKKHHYSQRYHHDINNEDADFYSHSTNKEVNDLIMSGSRIYSDFDLNGAKSKEFIFRHCSHILLISLCPSNRLQCLSQCLGRCYLYAAAQLDRARLV